MTDELLLPFPPELVEAIAQRAAALVLDQLGDGRSDRPLNVDEAAEFLRCRPQRIYDLVSEGRLAVPLRDGKRLLFTRDELERYLRAGASDQRRLAAGTPAL